jgi:hypothetical protein
MDETLTVEPFGFFTLDSLRAGWYLVWRQLVRVVPLAVVSALAGAGLGRLGFPVLGLLTCALGVLAAVVWAIVLVPQLASQWAESYHGYPLTGRARVWWAISWRSMVASAVAAVVLTPPTMVGASLSIAFPGSALGGLGKLIMGLLSLVNAAAAILTTGWAMSKVASMQLTGLPMTTLPFERVGGPVEPVAVSAGHHEQVTAETGHEMHEMPATPLAMAPAEPIAVAPAVTAPVAVAPAPVIVAPAPSPSRPAPVAVAAPALAHAPAEGKRQCPKCGLHETERGTVIGWYCTICGWRESRR